MENISNFNIKKKNKEFFKKEGYLVLRKFFDPKIISNLNCIIFENFKFFQKRKNIQIKNFDKYLIELRKKNKKKFGTFFDSLQTLGLGYSILLNKKILKFVSKLLNTKINCVTFTDMSLRLDPPHDERNSLGWHQDSSYFRQNFSGKNGIVIWIPLHHLDKNLGPLELLRHSNRLGPLNIKKKKIKSKLYSAKRNIDPKYLKKYKDIISKELKIGDALLTDLDLVHRSGKNISKKFRMSLIGRYHKLLSKDFNSGLNKYIYTNKKLNEEVHGK